MAIKQARRICLSCGKDIPILEPILILYTPTQPGENHIDVEDGLIKRWCLKCMVSDKVPAILIGAIQGAKRKDFSQYKVEIKAPKQFLSDIVQRFVLGGYPLEKISTVEIEIETVTATRWVSGRRKDTEFFAVGKPATIYRRFDLSPMQKP